MYCKKRLACILALTLVLWVCAGLTVSATDLSGIDGFVTALEGNSSYFTTQQQTTTSYNGKTYTRVDDNETFPGLVFSDGWDLESGNANDYKATQHGAPKSNTATVTFTAKCTELNLGVRCGPGAGAFQAYLDGVYLGTFHCLRESGVAGQVVAFQSGVLTPDTHTLEIRAYYNLSTLTAHQNNGNFTTMIDFFDYIPVTTTPAEDWTDAYQALPALGQQATYAYGKELEVLETAYAALSEEDRAAVAEDYATLANLQAAYTALAAETGILVDDADTDAAGNSVIVYGQTGNTPSWVTGTDANKIYDYNSTYTFNNWNTADAAALTFSGTNVKIAVRKGPGAGVAKVVLLDEEGNTLDTQEINTYADTRTPQQVIYDASDLTPGIYTVELYYVSTQTVMLDYMLYTPLPTSAETPVAILCNSSIAASNETDPAKSDLTWNMELVDQLADDLFATFNETYTVVDYGVIVTATEAAMDSYGRQLAENQNTAAKVDGQAYKTSFGSTAYSHFAYRRTGVKAGATRYTLFYLTYADADGTTYTVLSDANQQLAQ